MEPSTVQVTDPSGIVFDTTSGISLEEQQEILAGINAMAGGNRLTPGISVTKARKRGFLFPFFVNICALVLLGLGFMLLSHLHIQEDQGIRENFAALDLTERKLIQEIRQETNRQIEQKDNEINGILSKLSAADSEYRELQASVDTLTEEQKERAASLLKMQEDYRSSLSGLQEEKAKILEDSRQQETSLRAQAEQSVKELSSQIEQSQANLSSAMGELRRLSGEREQAAGIDAQMGGFYTALNSQLSAGRPDDAAATLAAMKEFLNTSSFQGNRSLEARRQNYLAAVAAMETAVKEGRLKMGGAAGEGAAVQAEVPETGQDDAPAAALAELQAKYTALEQKAADQERSIAAYSSQGTEQSKAIAAFESAINELKGENGKLSAANTNQQDTLNRRDTEIVNLRNQNATMQQQMSDLNQSTAALEARIQTATTRLSDNDAAIAALRAQVQTANTKAQQSDAALQEQQQQNADLTQKLSALQSQYDDLQRRMDAAVRAFQGN